MQILASSILSGIGVDVGRSWVSVDVGAGLGLLCVAVGKAVGVDLTRTVGVGVNTTKVIGSVGPSDPQPSVKTSTIIPRRLPRHFELNNGSVKFNQVSLFLKKHVFMNP